MADQAEERLEHAATERHAVLGGLTVSVDAHTLPSQSVHTTPVTDHKAPSAVNGVLLLADISGYTAFLQSVHSAHEDDAFADGAVPDAYAMMSSLLDGIIEQVSPPFWLSKLEGDAVFAYATDVAAVPHGAAMLDCIHECYADFRQRLGAARSIWPCWCDACALVGDLDLKFIVHAGTFVIQEIASGRELVGPEVVTAHRLLKTSAEELSGRRAYALITEAAVARVGVPTDTAIPIVETYEHCAPISASVFPLPVADAVDQQR